MKRFITVVMMLVLCFVSSCSIIGTKKASLADNVNGKWQGILEEFNGLKLVYTFNIEGDTVTGMVESEMGELLLSNGKVTGNSFTFEVDTGEMVIENVCTYVDGKIDLKFPTMDGGMILTRISE